MINKQIRTSLRIIINQLKTTLKNLQHRVILQINNPHPQAKTYQNHHFLATLFFKNELPSLMTIKWKPLFFDVFIQSTALAYLGLLVWWLNIFPNKDEIHCCWDVHAQIFEIESQTTFVRTFVWDIWTQYLLLFSTSFIFDLFFYRCMTYMEVIC